MARAQSGDGTAYHLLLSEILPYLRQVVRGVLGRAPGNDVAAVEDVVQETLISIHGARHTYDPNRPIKPWLAAIARRRCVDYQRRQCRHHAALATLAQQGDPPLVAAGNGQGPDILGCRALLRAIAALPARQRTAIRHLKLADMSLAEAAAETGLSQGALKVASHRGMISLRRMLGDLGD